MGDTNNPANENRPVARTWSPQFNQWFVVQLVLGDSVPKPWDLTLVAGNALCQAAKVQA
jgi:hypothetical protein